MPGRRPDWAGFLARYHAANPGITEDLFGSARDASGLTPYQWLSEVVPVAGTVIDVACGSAPLACHLPGRRVIGVDRSRAELGRARHSPGLVAQGDAFALPVADSVADAVTVSMALMLLSPVERVLSEAARSLRTGGVFAATVPARSSTPDPAAVAVDFSHILNLLGDAGQGYPEPLEPASVGSRFAAAGLTLIEDIGNLFVRSVLSRRDAEVVVRSFYAPRATGAMVASAVDLLDDRARSGMAGIGYPIRRLVAFRT